MGHVAHVHLDIMAVSVEKHVHQTVKILPVIKQMVHVTLAKQAIMGISVIMIALRTVKAISVLSSQESVMTVWPVSMEKTVKTAMDVSMAYVIRTVVYVNRAVTLVSMGITVMKRALIIARTVVTRLLRNVTLAKWDYSGINVKANAQQTAKMDSVVKIQGNVLKDVKR